MTNHLTSPKTTTSTTPREVIHGRQEGEGAVGDGTKQLTLWSDDCNAEYQGDCPQDGSHCYQQPNGSQNEE